MDKRLFTTTALSTAMGLAFAMLGATASAQGTKDMPPIVKENMERMKKDKLEKCYGINTVAKNDCAEGAHSCAGQATQARDPKSFVLLPAGVCGKIAGGNMKPV
ncbi:MAG: BufA1 family periplasmic bufferin-type metallophore [Cupriavidus necator]